MTHHIYIYRLLISYLRFSLLRLRMYSSYSSSSRSMGRPIVMCCPFKSGMSLEDVLLTKPASDTCAVKPNAKPSPLTESEVG